TRSQLGPVLEMHHVFPVEPRLQLLDPVHVDDRRAMHAHEAVRGEAGLEALELLPYDVRLAARVQLHVLAVSFDPVQPARSTHRLSLSPDAPLSLSRRSTVTIAE